MKSKQSDFQAGENPGEYITHGPVSEAAILAMAKQLIRRKLARGRVLDSPHSAREYLPHQLALLEHETFWVVFLNNQHRVLAFEQLFTGTVDQASVYPREIVKRGLQLNAKAVILAHNHPSGDSTPSRSDIAITAKIKDALALLDMTVLDHFIVGGDSVTSLAELGHC
jgi:DNA repair protein RadC